MDFHTDLSPSAYVPWAEVKIIKYIGQRSWLWAHPQHGAVRQMGDLSSGRSCTEPGVLLTAPAPPYTKPSVLENIFDKNPSAGSCEGRILCFPMTRSQLSIGWKRLMNCIRAKRYSVLITKWEQSSLQKNLAVTGCAQHARNWVQDYQDQSVATSSSCGNKKPKASHEKGHLSVLKRAITTAFFSIADGFLTAFTSAFSRLLAFQCTFGSWRVSQGC